MSRSLDAVQAAYRLAARRVAATEFVPLEQSRTLLRLFVQVKDDDLRQSILDLLRAIAGCPRVSSDGPNGLRPFGANRPGTDRPV